MSVAVGLETHPLAELIPPMSVEDYEALRDDIAANGLREPITLHEGKVLDGRHRARVCDELGLTPMTRDYDGDEAAKYVISLNVHRRHLTTSQRAEIALAALPHYKEQAKERQREGAALGGRAEASGHLTQSLNSTDHFRARDAAAADVGVSGITVARLERVSREAPDLHEQVKNGQATVSSAWSEVRSRETPSLTPAPFEIKTDRQRSVANKARERVEKAVGTCNGLARGLDGLKVEQAVAVASPEDIKGWIEALASANAALSRMAKRLREAS